MIDSAAENHCHRILLLGPLGQVGWELRRSLQSLGTVVPVGRQPAKSSRTSGQAQWTEAVDLANPDSLRRVIRSIQPTLIVNAAAYTAVDKAESEPDLAMAINGIAPGVLAEEARRIRCGLIHYSTDYVFDGSGTTPWREDNVPAPINMYGKSKLAGEVAIRDTEVGHLILRVSWVHGVHGANFVKTMLRLASQRPELSIVDDQIGAPTSARVIAEVTANLIAKLSTNTYEEMLNRGGTFHCACLGETSWHAYALEIFRQARDRGLSLAVQKVKPIPSSAYPVPATRPLNSRMNCDKLKQEFQLVPPSWQTALWHVLEEYIRLEKIDQDLAGKSSLLSAKTEEHAA